MNDPMEHVILIMLGLAALAGIALLFLVVGGGLALIIYGIAAAGSYSVWIPLAVLALLGIAWVLGREVDSW